MSNKKDNAGDSCAYVVVDFRTSKYDNLQKIAYHILQREKTYSHGMNKRNLTDFIVEVMLNSGRDELAPILGLISISKYITEKFKIQSVDEFYDFLENHEKFTIIHPELNKKRFKFNLENPDEKKVYDMLNGLPMKDKRAIISRKILNYCIMKPEIVFFTKMVSEELLNHLIAVFRQEGKCEYLDVILASILKNSELNAEQIKL